MLGFLIWSLLGIAFIGLGIYAYFSKKERAFGFWANAKTVPMKDVKAYNRALAKLYIVYGVVFILLGLPLLAGQNSPLIILSILGAALSTIVLMGVYIIKIEGKYRK